jgi:hypothetical protein
MEFDEALQMLGNSDERIAFVTTPGKAFVIMAQLQLALRHPDNTGEAATVAREVIEALLDSICAKVPEVEAAVRNLVEAGWNPDYDITRGEFDELYPLPEQEKSN